MIWKAAGSDKSCGFTCWKETKSSMCLIAHHRCKTQYSHFLSHACDGCHLQGSMYWKCLICTQRPSVLLCSHLFNVAYNCIKSYWLNEKELASTALWHPEQAALTNCDLWWVKLLTLASCPFIYHVERNHCLSVSHHGSYLHSSHFQWH